MKRVVIYSQSVELRALIRGLTSNIDICMQEIASREELFSACLLSKFDLVLTDDVRMFMNGSDAMTKIRLGRAVPQIFVLSHNLSEDCVVSLLEVGINQFITLPVLPEKLRKKVFAQPNYSV